MSKEYQDLIKYDSFFAQSLDNGFYDWFCSIRYRTKTGRRSKAYPIMILFSEDTGLLHHINIYDLPQGNSQSSKDKRKFIIDCSKEITGYFISVMIHHGYIEKVGE